MATSHKNQLKVSNSNSFQLKRVIENVIINIDKQINSVNLPAPAIAVFIVIVGYFSFIKFLEFIVRFA